MGGGKQARNKVQGHRTDAPSPFSDMAFRWACTAAPVSDMLGSYAETYARRHVEASRGTRVGH